MFVEQQGYKGRFIDQRKTNKTLKQLWHISTAISAINSTHFELQRNLHMTVIWFLNNPQTTWLFTCFYRSKSPRQSV